MEVENKQVFYSRAYIYFGIAFLVTIAGFYPSYFSRLGETGAAHHFHGITATLWMLILVLQPLLYRLNKMDWHRVLGRSTLLLVPLIIIGGLIMVWMMLNDERYTGFIAYRLAFIDFFIIAQFLLFYILALKNVKNTQYHARYMACTLFGPLTPALTRLLFIFPWVNSMPAALTISYILIELVLVALIVDDHRRGKIRLPYVLALGLMVTQHLMIYFVEEWSWWRQLMNLYGSI